VLTVVGVLVGLPLVLSLAWPLVVYSVATWHATSYTERVAPKVKLVADGKVEVTVDPGATQIAVKADAWYAWGWQAPTYSVTGSGDTVEIRHKCGRFPFDPSCEAALRVVLPADTELEVRTSNGHISASDLNGNVDVSSSDGRVELARINGDVVAHSGNGRVEVSDIVGSVTVTSSDGAVAITGVSGDVIKGRSGNGSVEATDVHGSATLHSSDGAVTASQIGGDVVAESGNGTVKVSDVRGSVTARSSDGAVVVDKITGDVIAARSGNGRVEVSGVTGSVSAYSSDGEVVVHTVDGEVDAGSGNGRVEAVSIGGSVTAESSDGAVVVEDVAGNVVARSGNGSVTVYGPGVPVALDISTGNGRQTVEAATDPAASITVTIHSSDGRVSYLAPRGPSRLSTVPDVVGLAQDEAVAAVQAAGFLVQVDYEPSDVPQGQVLHTTPGPGTSSIRGTTIMVTVAS